MAINETTTNSFRVEEDALGDVEVPANHLWGAQTQRSRANFMIGVERFRWGRPVIRALGILKKCAALANGELGQLPKEKVDLIVRAAQEVIDGLLNSWCAETRMRFGKDKTQWVVFDKTQGPFATKDFSRYLQYRLCGFSPQVVEEYKYLGVTHHRQLDWQT